jgi:hypothetical protein
MTDMATAPSELTSRTMRSGSATPGFSTCYGLAARGRTHVGFVTRVVLAGASDGFIVNCCKPANDEMSASAAHHGMSAATVHGTHQREARLWQLGQHKVRLKGLVGVGDRRDRPPGGRLAVADRRPIADRLEDAAGADDDEAAGGEAGGGEVVEQLLRGDGGGGRTGDEVGGAAAASGGCCCCGGGGYADAPRSSSAALNPAAAATMGFP